MTAPIYVKPSRRRSLSFCMDPGILDQIKVEAKKQKIPASRLVEAIIRSHFSKGKSK